MLPIRPSRLACLATLVFLQSVALAGDVRIEVTGIVNSAAGTLPAPFDSAAAGDPFELVVEVIDKPDMVSPTYWENPTDLLVGFVRVGSGQASTNTLGSGTVNLQNEAIDAITIGSPIDAGVGVAVAVGTIDVTGTLLSGPDLNALVGQTLAPPPFGTGVLLSTSPPGQLDLTLTEIRFLVGTQPRFGTNYCDAELNSASREAAMAGLGSAVVASNDARLSAYNLPTNAFGFFLGSRASGFAAMPGGSQGNLCLGGSIGRFVGPGQIQNSGASGRIDLQLDLTSLPTPNGLVAAAPGEDWYFTAWYRDAVGGSPTSNFADGRRGDFQ